MIVEIQHLDYGYSDRHYHIFYKGIKICHVDSYSPRLSANDNMNRNLNRAMKIIHSLGSGLHPDSCCLCKKIREIWRKECNESS